MPKIYKTTITLVIVESPAKCKKIEEYLGPGYKCIASFGHLRELTSLKNIDFANNFNANYTNIENPIKTKQISLLKKVIASADDVILATDDDREGEAIAWHICMMFNLNIEKTKRIVFHEITESAILNAIKNPRILNMNIVNAQQARQILDLLVGFKISPILWNNIVKNIPPWDIMNFLMSPLKRNMAALLINWRQKLNLIFKIIFPYRNNFISK